MKTNKLRLAALLMPLFTMTIFAACSSSDTEDFVEDILPSTNVRAIHLSPDTPEVDLDYKVVEVQTTIVGLSYTEASPYSDISTGANEVIVRRASDGMEIATDDGFVFDNDSDHTVYMVNFASNVEFVDSDDDRSADAGVTKIRFVHASPDAPAQVDLKTDAPDGTVVFSGVGFKDITDYATVDPGVHTFIVTATGDSTNALAAFEPVSLDGGTVYTMVALGTVNATDSYNFGLRAFNDTAAGGDGFTDLTLAP